MDRSLLRSGVGVRHLVPVWKQIGVVNARADRAVVALDQMEVVVKLELI